MKVKYILVVFLILLQFKAIAQPACGTCALPVCKIYGPVTGSSLGDAASKTKTELTSNPLGFGIDLNYDAMLGMAMPLTGSTPKNWTYCYKFNISNNNTTLGLKLGLKGMNGNPLAVAHLYKESESVCNSLVEIPSTRTKVDASSFFNPEWDGLASGNYKVCIDYSLLTSSDVISTIYLGYYTYSSSTPPATLPCGTVGFDWRNSGSQPKPTNSQLTTCIDKDFSLKADEITDATQYIAPGFDLDDIIGDLNLTKLEIDEGGTGTYLSIPVTSTTYKYCSPGLIYKLRLTGNVNTGGSGVVSLVDHATGDDLYVGPFTSGMEITLAPGKIKGTATFSGPGVSNYKLDAPTAGATTFLGSGYGVFNPFKAGNGPHKIRYDWDNGSGPCGFSEITVTVSGCTQPVCQPVDFELYDVSDLTAKHTGNSFTCSSPVVYLAPKDFISTYTGGALGNPDPSWPFPVMSIDITATSGTLTNLNLNIYDAVTGALVETNSASATVYHFFSKPNGYTISLDKTNSNSGTYTYNVYDVMTGAVIGTGTLTVTGGVESSKSAVIKPTNFNGGFTCATCGTGALIQGIAPQYLDEIGIGTFDPKKAGNGSHDIIYTWDNELSGSKHCIGTKTITVNVTGGPSGTASIGDICQGTSPALISIPAASLTGTPTTFSIDWDATANTAGLRDIVDTTIAASSFKLSKTIAAGNYSGKFSVKNSAGCSSTPVAITIKVMSNPTISPITAEICVDASISLSGSGGSGTPNATPWSQENSKVLMSGSGTSRSFKGITAGDCYVVYKDDKGCTDTVTIKVNGNPTLTATPTSILVGGTSSVSVSGGSGPGALLNTWKTLSNTANILSGVTGNTQPITVTGVATGNEDIIYTDNKGCDDTVTIVVSILGCNTIIKITPDQTWCQGIDPNALEFSTIETATDGISFVVFPAASKPVNAAAVYTTGVTFTKKTPLSGKVLLDLPTLGSTISGALPVVLAGEYYIYAILTSPNTTSCRSNAEIKVTIKDSIIPVITSGIVASNATTFTWSDIPSASKFGVDTARLVNPVMPFPWKSANDISNTTAGTGNTFTFSGIPLGQTAHIKITPLDNSSNKLACSNSAISSILNPKCPNPPVLEPLITPDTVCVGQSLDKLIGKISSTSVLVNFKWFSSTDSLNWSPISLPSTDYDTISTTLFKEQTLEIKNSKISMNNSFIRLIGYDKATGQCSDTTLPVKILVNKIPDASLSISPDPAKLCVGDPKPIEVTFQGTNGLEPYRFDFKLDGALKDTTSSSPDGKVLFSFNTVNPIEDSTFILDSITDKNGCTARFTGKKVKLEVIPLPLLGFQADKTIGCYPLEVIFTDTSASTLPNTNVEWDFGNGDLDNKSLGVVKYVFQKSGDYTIKFKSTINGCWDTMIKTNYIHVKDRPEAQFSPKKTNISLIDPEIQFVNSSSSNSIYYKWIFGDGSPVSNLVNPKHIYIGDGSNGLPNPGNYTVELYAYINQDCWDSTSTIITIDDEQIYYIPNTFTPNGDEKNNTFQPVFTSGYDAQNYHFFVYNRWGELIFESNNPAIGWDGTYGNKLLGNDTYSWKLQFKEKMTEKEHFLTGHVNLFK